MDTGLADLARDLHQLSRGSVRKISASGPSWPGARGEKS